MIVPSAIRRRYEELDPELEALARAVRDTIVAFCDREGFAYAGRRKTLESLAEKIETGRFKRWSDLDDLFGCSIVIPKLDQQTFVLEFLRSAFDEVETKLRGSTRKAPDVFRFDTTRFYGRLRPARSSDVPLARHHTTFEVQVRTAYEHAWMVTTHAIYKGGSIDWRSRRLVAQMRAAIEQLDHLVQVFDHVSEPISRQDWPELDAMRVLADGFVNFVEQSLIPLEIAPKDWSRFAESLLAMVQPRPGGKGPRPQLEDLAKEVLACMRVELENGPPVPLSISLLQYTFVSARRNQSCAA